MHNYIGLIYKETDSDYGVSFPDFPGVVTAGKDLDDARAMAEEALAFHIAGMVADGTTVPEPSRLEDVMGNAENRSAVAILVAAKTELPKAIRVNVTLPEDLLIEIDQFAAANGYTRSGFLATAATEVMKRRAA
jgi:predicted RNase H-like HicB family nuclease